MRIVCGKCGSANIYEPQGVVPGDGQTGHSLSCLKCGNTSESKKYGFTIHPTTIHQERQGERKMAFKGDCSNCGRKDRPLCKCNPPLCWTCQQAAQGKTGEERLRALAEVKEKIINGGVTRGGSKLRKNKTVKAKAENGGDCGAVVTGSSPSRPAKVEGYHSLSSEESITSVPHSHSHVPSRDVIVLAFKTPADWKLLEKIEIMARQYRRTVDQQILWICQNERQLHEDLLKEAEADHGV